jgi:glycosyltransferase involved in cell wall biosynthesis
MAAPGTIDINRTNSVIMASDHHWRDTKYYDRTSNDHRLNARHKKHVKTIGLYYWRLHDGGTERVTSRLASIWCSLGYRVILFTDEEPQDIDYAHDPRVERMSLPPHRQRYIDRGIALARILRDEKIDVFVTNLWVETATAWDLFVAKSLGIPVIIGWHNVFDAGTYGGHDIEYLKQRISAYRCADLVVSLSKMDQYWFSSQNIPSRLIHNPLTFSAMPKLPAPAPVENVILWIGRAEKHQKRIDHAIRMLPIVLQRVPDAILLVVGDGPDREEAEALAMSLGVALSVRFIGYSPKVEQYIDKASVHVMTSEFEGSPMVLSEVWAHGVPTVMYDLAYLSFLEQRKGHVAVEQKDLQALGYAVADVLLDSQLRTRLGREARAIAQSFYNYDLAAAWKSVFDDIETKDDLAAPLTPGEIAAVAPMLVKHLTGRLYEVNARLHPVQQPPEPAPTITTPPPITGPLPRRLLLHVARRVTRWANVTYDKRWGLGFEKLRTIDLAQIGLGDNLMAWVGLHALLSSGAPLVAANCVLYVPSTLAPLATTIFGRFGLTVKGMAPHSRVDPISPLFTSLPPERMWQWYKAFVGVDWRVNCFEALDLQKSIARRNFPDTQKTRFRLNLSERRYYHRNSWKDAEPNYIGYRFWLPLARKLGIPTIQFLSLIKQYLPNFRAAFSAYIDSIDVPQTLIAPEIAVFPTGKAFQAFSPTVCGTIHSELQRLKPTFFVQKDDPWIDRYVAEGIEPQFLDSTDEIFWTVKHAKKVLTTDSFTSHIAQLLRDDFVLVLARDFRENVVHPGANPTTVSNHPSCAPCNYHSRAEADICPAGYGYCVAFSNSEFVSRIINAVRQSDPTPGLETQ